jgi:CHASE3 domain sensor protein
MANTTLSSNSFKKMLTRNVALPLLLSTALCGVFIGLILYMLSVNRWLDHSDQVIAKTNEIFKMTIDSETGLRGYLLTGDENFLEPYDRAETQLAPAFQELRLLVSDNAIETQRIDQISHLIAQWREYALDQMNLRRSPQYNPKKKVELAKSQMDGIRGVFHQLLEMEDSLRVERTENVQTTTRWLLAVILLFSAISGTILAIFGRKQLLQLSTEYESALQIQNKQNESLQEQARLLELQKDSLDRQNLYLKDAQESVKKSWKQQTGTSQSFSRTCRMNSERH